MYFIKYRKKDRNHFYLYNDRLFIRRFYTFLELYYYVRENKIDFTNIKTTVTFDLLFYHFIDFNDLEKQYMYYSNNRRIHDLNKKGGLFNDNI